MAASAWHRPALSAHPATEEFDSRDTPVPAVFYSRPPLTGLGWACLVPCQGSQLPTGTRITFLHGKAGPRPHRCTEVSICSLGRCFLQPHVLAGGAVRGTSWAFCFGCLWFFGGGLFGLFGLQCLVAPSLLCVTHPQIYSSVKPCGAGDAASSMSCCGFGSGSCKVAALGG